MILRDLLSRISKIFIVKSMYSLVDERVPTSKKEVGTTNGDQTINEGSN
jgi:hypothetical protein